MRRKLQISERPGRVRSADFSRAAEKRSGSGEWGCSGFYILRMFRIVPNDFSEFFLFEHESWKSVFSTR